MPTWLLVKTLVYTSVTVNVNIAFIPHCHGPRNIYPSSLAPWLKNGDTATQNHFPSKSAPLFDNSGHANPQRPVEHDVYHEIQHIPQTNRQSEHIIIYNNDI